MLHVIVPATAFNEQRALTEPATSAELPKLREAPGPSFACSILPTMSSKSKPTVAKVTKPQAKGQSDIDPSISCKQERLYHPTIGPKSPRH